MRVPRETKSDARQARSRLQRMITRGADRKTKPRARIIPSPWQEIKLIKIQKYTFNFKKLWTPRTLGKNQSVRRKSTTLAGNQRHFTNLKPNKYQSININTNDLNRMKKTLSGITMDGILAVKLEFVAKNLELWTLK